MKEFYIEIQQGEKENTIKGEALLLKAFRRLQKGRYRCQLYSTNKRSLNQNSYMHVVFTLMQKGFYNAGWEHITTPQAAKDECKRLFLSYEVANKQTGEMKPTTRHTSQLTKEECAHFIDQIIQHAAEYLGVYVPTPEEYYKNHSRYDLVTLAA